MRLRFLPILCLMLHAIANGEVLRPSDDPLSVSLNVGHERRIDWPVAVEVALPSYLQSVLRVQSIKRSTYWLATMPFQATRVLARDVGSGETWVLELTASQGERGLPPLTVADDVGQAPGTHRLPYVQLVRTAASALFAPRRLQQKPLGFVREPVSRDKVDLLVASGTSTTPLGQWRYMGHFVTAVEIKNLNAQPIVLDARLLRGTWSAAAFMHFRLLGAPSDASITVVYLISTAPFDEIMTRGPHAR